MFHSSFWQAIDLIDEAGSRARIAAHRKRRERVLETYGKNDDIVSVSKNGIDERSADLWNELREVQKRKAGKSLGLFGSQKRTTGATNSVMGDELIVVSEEDIASVCR